VIFSEEKSPAAAGLFVMNGTGADHPMTLGPKKARGAHMMMSGKKMHIIRPTHCKQTNGTTPL
jgi:hypothetical protein